MLRIHLVTAFQRELDPLCLALRQLRWCLEERVEVVPSTSLPPPLDGPLGDGRPGGVAPDEGLPADPSPGARAVSPDRFGGVFGVVPGAPPSPPGGGRVTPFFVAWGVSAEGPAFPARRVTGATSHHLAWGILEPCLPPFARDFLALVPRHANPELCLLGARYLLELAEAPPFDLPGWTDPRTRRGELSERVREILGEDGAVRWTTSARLYTVLRRQDREDPGLLGALGFGSPAEVEEGCLALAGLDDALAQGWQPFLQALADGMGEGGWSPASARAAKGDAEEGSDEEAPVAPWSEERFAKLRERFFSLAVSEALARVGDPAIAESVANEVFAAVWAQGDRADRELTKAYFRRAARNRALNRLEGARRWRELRADQDPDGSPSRLPDPLSLVEEGETRDELDRAFRAIDPVQGLALLLTDVFEWAHRDVAELLDLSVDAVRGRGKRGLAALRKQFPDAR